jgi:hypothetical protein
MRMVTALLVLLLWPSVLFADPTGLETGGSKDVFVIVEEVTKDGPQISLTGESIAAQVELQLRKNGLKPHRDFNRGGTLSINTVILDEFFAIEIGFHRLVYYNVDKPLNIFGRVWKRASVGYHGGNSEYVMKAVLEKLDIFIAEYLNANNL